MPYFEKMVIGAFIKANLGIPDVTSSTGYQICQVKDVSECPHAYSVDGVTTRKALKIMLDNKTERTIRLLYISNSGIDKDEFVAWKSRIESLDGKLPTLAEMKKKAKQISAALHYHLTESEIQKVIFLNHC